MPPSFTSPSTPQQPRGGFALVIALSLMAFVLLLLLSITTLVQIESRSAQIASARVEAEQAALLGLQVALGELQKAAGPDQRVTAAADILANDGARAPVQGRSHWVGVWNTSTYSPANPDAKTFNRWLVSSNDPDGFSADTHANDGALAEPYTIFTAVDTAGNRVPGNDVVVDKVPIANASSTGESHYAYWVEDEGVKADLSWNEGAFTDDERKQAARLSSAPGVDYGVFGSDAASPFNGQVTYPIVEDSSGNSWLANLSKVVSTVGLSLATGSDQDATDWLKAFRHDLTFGSRAVLCDVKNGGLRRDLSLAFEMDGDAESENATFFNQQAGEFVAGTDTLTAIQNALGMTVLDRFLFRDFSGAGNAFSGAITASETVVRGPSWWLMRDYANLYKRLKTSGSHYALDARAYFPNRTTANPNNNLFDIHARNGDDGNIRVSALNRESSSSTGAYAFRPVRASYAPVLLGVNAIYSLVYRNNQLQMVVDPFFILWNPYDTRISAEKFAVTLENGLAGGVLFKITDTKGTVDDNSDDVETIHGKPTEANNGKWLERGTDTSFADYAKHKSGGENANVSYLISDLTMNAGEILFYSPPKAAERGSDANVLNDELVPGMNYDPLTSGIFFDEFPDETGSNWAPVAVDSAQSGNFTIDVMFNILSHSGYAIENFIETNLPPSGRKPDELTTEANFGAHLSGKEFRLNKGQRQLSRNIDNGVRGYSLSYGFDELGTAKQPFGILSMLTIPTDHAEADTAMEVFSQLNVTAAVCTNTELFYRAPFNVVVKVISAYGYNNLMETVGLDLDAIGTSGNNGYYGKSYGLAEGDSSFPLLSIPQSPLYSLVQFSEANIGTRLFEPTHAIGNSWKPPYIPADSIYSPFRDDGENNTFNDVSWQCNDALFDRYYLSGIAPAYTIGADGYEVDAGNASVGIETTLEAFYGSNPEFAKANPALEPYLPDGMTATQVEDLLAPADGYQKLGAYSLISGAFNVNSTSVAAWSAFLQGNKDLATDSIQGTSDSTTGTPFPLSSSVSDTASINGWEKYSRLTDEQIWDDQDTANDTSDDTGLAVEIVNQVRARGPFMSLSDFVNRRITADSRSYQGAIQEAIEQAGINGNQASGIRANTSETIPNYSDYADVFPHAEAPYLGARNNATGIPLEINQANILLPIAPKLTARSDTFKIRAYGQVTTIGGGVVKAICEATVQRVPEYINPVDAPWSENYTNPLFSTGAPQLDSINQTFGRRFKIVNLRWLDQAEI